MRTHCHKPPHTHCILVFWCCYRNTGHL